MKRQTSPAHLSPGGPSPSISNRMLPSAEMALPSFLPADTLFFGEDPAAVPSSEGAFPPSPHLPFLSFHVAIFPRQRWEKIPFCSSEEFPLLGPLAPYIGKTSPLPRNIGPVFFPFDRAMIRQPVFLKPCVSSETIFLIKPPSTSFWT